MNATTLRALNNLTSLDLNSPSDVNKDAWIAPLVGLKRLTLNGDGFTNACLVSLTNLTHLDIRRASSITNEGLASLPQLTSLAVNENITDQGLAPLAPQLRLLELKRGMNHNVPSGITAECILQMSSLTSLSIEQASGVK